MTRMLIRVEQIALTLHAVHDVLLELDERVRVEQGGDALAGGEAAQPLLPLLPRAPPALFRARVALVDFAHAASLLARMM